MTPEERKTIIDAAQAIVDRWDSPAWKYGDPHTGVLIRNLERALALLRADPEAREPMGYTATECSDIARKRYADEPRKTFQQQQYAQGLEDGYGHALFEHIGK